MNNAKIKMLKWVHPSFDSWLITPTTWTSEEVAKNYLEDGSDPRLLEKGEVEMTQAEIDALPEFDG